MGTVNPRPRGSGDLRSELRTSRDDRQQIRRLAATRPQPKPAAPAPAPSGGGIVSGVRWYGFGTVGHSGDTAGTGIAINFDPSASHAPQQIGPNPAPAFTHSGGSFVAAAGGYYSFDLTAQLFFGSDPGKIYLSWMSSWDRANPTGPLFLTQTWPSPGPGGGQLQARDSRTVYLAAGESHDLGFAWDNSSTCFVWSAEMDIFRLS